MTKQYFWGQEDCPVNKGNPVATCTCWFDEGTGPAANVKFEGNQTLQWRDKLLGGGPVMHGLEYVPEGTEVFEEGKFKINPEGPLSKLNEEKKPPKKVNYIGAPATFALELACKHLNRAFPGRCYVVGSVLQGPGHRDVDVRLMMNDEEFMKLFPDVHNLQGTWEFDTRWLLMTVQTSQWLSQQTGLNIDFQFQPSSWGNSQHGGPNKPRHPVGLTYAKPERNDDDE